MASLHRLYHNTVPRGFRERFWHLRNDGLRATMRGYLAMSRLALGRPLVRVRVGDANLRVDLRDEGVGRPIYVSGQYEPHETAFVRRVLKAGMTVFDVGANVGYYTTLASKLVGGSGRVFAAEPDPGNFALLAENVRSNASANVTLLNVGIGATPGRASLFRSAANSGDHRLYAGDSETRDFVEVAGETVDGVAESQNVRSIDFVKMDVQGYEYRVLLGMKKTLEASPGAVVLTEFWPEGMRMAGGSPPEFFDYFITHGYSAVALLGDGGLSKVGYGDVMEIIDRKAKDGNVEGNFLNLVFSKIAMS